MRDPVLAVMDEPEIERREEGNGEADADDHVHRLRVGEAEEEGRQRSSTRRRRARSTPPTRRRSSGPRATAPLSPRRRATHRRRRRRGRKRTATARGTAALREGGCRGQGSASGRCRLLICVPHIELPRGAVGTSMPIAVRPKATAARQRRINRTRCVNARRPNWWPTPGVLRRSIAAMMRDRSTAPAGAVPAGIIADVRLYLRGAPCPPCPAHPAPADTARTAPRP